MPDHNLKKIVQLASVEEPEKPLKTKRLLLLDSENYQKLQEICRDRNVSVSKTVDSLIAAYLYYQEQERIEAAATVEPRPSKQ